MELKSLFPRAQELVITTPDGTPTGLKLQLVGQDSKEFRAIAKRLAQRQLDKTKTTVDEMESDNAAMAASCIVGWPESLTMEGLPFPYSPTNAVLLMMNPQVNYIREQVEAFVSERVNFFRVAATPT